MSTITYTGIYPSIVTTTTGSGSGGGGAFPIATGTTRWNSTNNMMEMFDGVRWVAVSAGDIQAVTLSDMVENAEDRIAAMINEEQPNNVTIQDAFKEWEEANKRFKVILKLAETK